MSDPAVQRHLSQQGEGDEITEGGAQDDTQKDPDVVGHDAEHQHVAQSHLQNVEAGLDDVQQPAGDQQSEPLVGHTQLYSVRLLNLGVTLQKLNK